MKALKKLARLPRHIAFIMDGNGRWAEQRQMPRIEGHRAGTDNARVIVRRLGEYGIEYATLYSFSTENWNRPQDEVNALLEILAESLEDETRELHKNNVQLHHIGRLERLPDSLRQAIHNSIQLTKDNTGLRLSLAFDYGGRAEIIDAVRDIAARNIPPERIDEELFARHLYTAGMPYVDLVVRTGGELRISNFLLWQSAYSEYYFSEVLWPDFDQDELDKALLAFSRRRRRFGSV